MPKLTREQVHDSLRVLHEPLALCGSPLAAGFPEAASADLEKSASRLRALLLQAVEALQPARRYPFGSLESRSYDVLSLRYVEGMSIRQISSELSLSERQVHRDLWRAEERLRAVINRQHSAGADETESETGPFEDELEYLRSQPAQVELVDVLMQAIDLVSPLADQLGRQIRYVGETRETVIAADRGVLKQCLAQLLSAAVQSAAGDCVVALDSEAESVAVCLRLAPRDDDLLHRLLGDLERIAEAKGYGIQVLALAEGNRELRLRMPTAKVASVLVIEDNPGAVELYSRYLSSENWQVQSVTDPRRAPSVAAELRPDVIVLDIMMPKMDGWTILETLSRSTATQHIPVMICSVVQDERLGQVLGATVQLLKPVSRGDFLAGIRRCLEKGQARP